ncbi:ABC transporter ATP-binding protein [Dactylosporangium sucinum]|uniref:ABC transporter domain-containing protein n=1 Tax=Dactylosporangium sucinum TaxID=1424081 RepID=A0A917X5B0_9ACTN|nr:dipeptide/oligopeptide/nickel ABC transporter ATP-binding protein [Dactylosporangium sucinum]GGM69754.1 hypothetical protein GCM10007977_084350 [Dactylosporangium sucinum]
MPAATEHPGPVVQAEHVSVRYGSRRHPHDALRDVSFQVRQGETLAVIGESGAGKSTLTRVVAGLEQPTGGQVRINGRIPVVRSGVISPVQIVFQNPLLALNPHCSVGASVAEPLRALPRRARAERVAALVDAVGLNPRRAGERPGAFSGGQLQRLVLARALAAEPQVLICDEATSALDVSVQAQIVNLILDLQATQNYACLFVTHDLAAARVVADQVMVLRQGRCLELAPAGQFFRQPSSDYARSLLTLSGNRPAHAHEEIL